MNQKTKGKYIGLIGAIAVHAVVLIFLVLTFFSLPEPEEESGLPVMVEYDYFPAAGSVAVGKHRGNEQQACQPRRRLQVAGFVFEQVVAEAENHAVDERHGEGGRVEVFEVDDVGGEGLEAAGQGTAQDFARRHQDLPHGGRQREAGGCSV